jgi:hypothetical protein
VELRFRGAYAYAQHFGDLFVFVPLDIVQQEYCPVSRRKLGYGLLKSQALDHRDSPRALKRRFDKVGEIAFLARVLKLYPALAKVHKHLIDRQTVQPGREGRIASKTLELSEDLHEHFLRKVFGQSRVAEHPQAKRIYPPVVLLV